MFIIWVCQKEIPVKVEDEVKSIKVCWAEWMVWATPVFDTRENAEKYIKTMYKEDVKIYEFEQFK